MELSYDLHLHSCLSPCGDMDMTPANIAGMAYIKGLNIIALTDHNASRNCPALMKHAEEYGIIAIPGMELTTLEEVHVVCLFPELENALDWDRYVHERLMKIKNKPKIFGEQYVLDENDEKIDEEPYLLINATEISFSEVKDHLKPFEGLMIPAHVDKTANGLIAMLGTVPPDSDFTCAEVHDLKKLHGIIKDHPYFENCRIICDSDAHYLPDIHEAEYTLSFPNDHPTRREILQTLATVPTKV